MSDEQEIQQLREDLGRVRQSVIAAATEGVKLLTENARLRTALTDLLPGYEQYLEWCVERGVLFVSEGRKMLADAREALEPKP